MTLTRTNSWRLILDTALDAVIVMDTGGTVVDWNDGARAIFGWERSETLGRNMAELIIPPQLRAAHSQGLQRFVATGEKRVIGRRIEITGLRKSGEEFPVELSIAPLSEETGLVFVGFLRDLSARKRSEAELRESEERFSKAFNASAHPMSITTLKEGRYVDINAAGLAASGMERQEVLGRTIHELGFYDDPENARTIRELLVKHRHFKDVETTLKGARGSRVYLLSGALVELRGEPCLLTSAVDITERKRAEDHVRLLMHEINHRANNLLSVVLALVRQTGKAHGDERISNRIFERVRGLTASNSLLISGEWHGADLAALIQSQLAHFADVSTRVSARGPAIRLNATAAQAVGMALHELATNAVKYGALSVSDGGIAIEWRTAGDEENRTFHMTWTERGGPPVEAPQRTGFGRIVMEEMICQALSGETDLQFHRGGIVWSLQCPAREALESTEKHSSADVAVGQRAT